MEKIKKLMFVSKFEQLGFDALQSLLDLRNASLDHVVFLYVIEREKVAMQRGVGYKKSQEIKLRETANIRFIDWAENLFEQGMEAGVYIVVGHLVPEVIKATKKENADLIVVGRSHKGVIEQLYSGADVTELLRRVAVPVLVFKHVPDSGTSFERPFERPLLATDWSPATQKAIEYLKDFGNITQEINVVHVASEKDLVGPSSFEVQKTRKEARQKLEDVCDIFEALGMKARPHVYIGDPVEEIEKAARECKATMIVLGSSAKAVWAERWLGSIPRRFAEKSIYPTLIIPPEKS